MLPNQYNADAAKVNRQRPPVLTHNMAGLDPSSLRELLGSGDPALEAAAAQALLGYGKDSVPMLLEGLGHARAKIRAACALLLDHVADNRCIASLLHAIRYDPHEAVRRCALHSLICDGCKECPLSTDVIQVLLEVIQTDRSKSVRRRAVFYLSQQRFDQRVAPFLTDFLQSETDPILLQRARIALAHHQGTVVPAEAHENNLRFKAQA